MEKREYELAVANEIRAQIMATDRMAMAAWGAHNLYAIPEGTKAGGVEDGTPVLGGLQLDVKGAKFKGCMRILLMPDDTYRVELVKRKYEKVCGRRMFVGNVVDKVLEGAYCDNLMTVIDGMIER